VRGDEIANLGVNQLAPSPTAKNAVVACAHGNMVLLVRWGKIGCQAMSGLGLARTRDIVKLALNREKRHIPYRFRVYPKQLAIHIDIPGSIRKLVLLKTV
jgi:hypothetical protein